MSDGRVPDAGAPVRPAERASEPRDPTRVAASSLNRQSEPPVPCERCGTGMFRMHAVWRCPACGFKTDCCGW